MGAFTPFMTTEICVCIATLIGVTAVVAWGLQVLNRQEDRAHQRLLELLKTLHDPQQSRSSLLKDETFSLSPFLGQDTALAERILGWNTQIRRFYDQSGIPISGSAFFALSLSLFALAEALAAVFQLPGYAYLVIGCATVVLPFVIVSQCRTRRQRELSRQLPDALELIARCIRAGNGLGVGIRGAADEMLPPIAIEFRRVCDTHQLGIPIEDALQNMVDRVPDRSIKFFATAVALHKKYGGNLAEVLDKISYIVRDRFKILGQVGALTAEGRLSGIVLMALPLLMFAAIYFLNRSYVMVLFSDPVGQKMLGGAILLQFLGAWSIRRIVQIDI